MHDATQSLTLLCALSFGAAGCAAQENVAPPEPAAEETLDTPTIDSGARFVPAWSGLPESGMWKCDPYFADVNLDGHMDLAGIPRLGLGPQVWFGDGQGNWQNASEGLQMEQRSCGGGVSVTDVNGDKHMDLVVADHCNGIFVYLGDGAGTWTKVVSRLHPVDMISEEDAGLETMFLGAEDLDTGDFNGDGHADIVACASDEGGMSVYLGDGTGTTWSRLPGALPELGWAYRVRAVDMNGDDIVDVVATHGTGPKVWVNDGEGNFTPASEGLPRPTWIGIYQGLDVADLNNDGRTDLLVSNWIDGPEVYFQTDSGAWEKQEGVFPGMLGGSVGVAAAELTGDEHLDIIVAGRIRPKPGLTRGVQLLVGQGNGKWAFDPDTDLPASGMLQMGGAATGDINADGIDDVAVGTGLLVESAAGSTTPVVSARLPVWITVPGPAAETNESSEKDQSQQPPDGSS